MKFVVAAVLFLLVLLSSHHGGVAAVPTIIGVIRGDSTNVLFGSHIVPLYHQGVAHSNLLIDNGQGATYLYRGGRDFDTVPFQVFDTTSSYNGSGADIGDLDGDGYDEFTLKWGYFSWQRLRLYHGGPQMSVHPDLWLGLDTLKAVGPVGICSNLRGDGHKYLVCGGDGNYTSSVLLFDLSASTDSIPYGQLHSIGVPPINSGGLGQDIAFGDFNGDGVTDLAASLVMSPASPRSGEVWIYYGGDLFDTIPNLILRRPGPFDQSATYFGSQVECPGDLNRDGFDDLIVCGAGTDTTVYGYFGASSRDTSSDFSFAPNAELIRSAGDINGDGYPDFFLTTPSPYYGGGKVRLYYGGVTINSEPGMTIHDWELSSYNTGFGYGCTGIGDFDGDGSNDFAFSLYDNQSRGWVYIFSGQKSGTDVDHDHNGGLPITFTLHPVCPNPFNPSTTISFDLPKRSNVRIAVYDITGRQVKVLATRDFSAGSHSVTWDGTTNTGKPAASGAYFFKLTADGVTKSVKGMLVK